MIMKATQPTVWLVTSPHKLNIVELLLFISLTQNCLMFNSNYNKLWLYLMGKLKLTDIKKNDLSPFIRSQVLGRDLGSKHTPPALPCS